MLRIYHYEPTHKFYLGMELIDDKRPSQGLPAFSTDTPPPFTLCPEGHIPIFHESEWKIVLDNFWRPTIVEKNYDAGRSMTTLAPMVLSPFAGEFPAYPSMPMLCNTALVVIAICQKTRMIHKKFELLTAIHGAMLGGVAPVIPIDVPDRERYATVPTAQFEYKLEAESMVFLMRRVLDSMVQLSYLLTNYSDFWASKEISVNEIGKFIQVAAPTTDLERIIVGDGITYQSDNTGFLETINDLFNSFKHCLMHDESYNIFGETTPTLITYQAKQNRHRQSITFHNHNAHHLLMGYQDTVRRILRNQHTYLEQQIKREEHQNGAAGHDQD